MEGADFHSERCRLFFIQNDGDYTHYWFNNIITMTFRIISTQNDEDYIRILSPNTLNSNIKQTCTPNMI